MMCFGGDWRKSHTVNHMFVRVRKVEKLVQLTLAFRVQEILHFLTHQPKNVINIRALKMQEEPHGPGGSL